MSNLTTSYLAIQEQRTQLDAQAGRGWQVDQAVATRSGGTLAGRAGRRMGTLLEAMGERLRRTPADRQVSVAPTHPNAHS